MGCHTWFAKPVTDKEFEVFKANAIDDAWKLYGDTKENREFNCVDMGEYYRVKDSVEHNTDYWWRCGFGTTIRNEDGIAEKSEITYVVSGVMYLDLSKPTNPIFPELKRYHDVFRVKNYPTKIIRSRHELRKCMKKKYFDLDQYQLNKVSEFFMENPGGIITFG